MSTIQLQSSDGEIFEVAEDIASIAQVIQTKITDMGDNQQTIQLEDVEAHVLERVIKWMTHHKDLPPPVDEELCSWDANFFNPLDKDTRYKILLAANALQIKGLMTVAETAIANRLIGTTLAEVQVAFHDQKNSASEKKHAPNAK